MRTLESRKWPMNDRNDRNDQKKNGKWIRRLIVGGAMLSLLAGLSLLAAVWGIEYMVDIWWFDALGYGFYYWQRLLYRYAVFILVTLFFFTIFFLNFWTAARFNPLRRAEAAPGSTGIRSAKAPRCTPRWTPLAISWR